MKILIQRRPLRKILSWTQRALLAGGLLTLGYCAYVMADAWIFQKEESNELTDLLTEKLTSASLHTPAIAAGKGLVGRIEIPRLGVSVVVMEGTGNRTLRHAVGHIEGTALPAEHGNVGISGHRDTFFRPLKDIRSGDSITVTTPTGDYQYRVVSMKVVSPDDVSVLSSDGGDSLTLVTCYPFYYVGPAPKRFIVRAEQTSESNRVGRTAGLQPFGALLHPKL